MEGVKKLKVQVKEIRESQKISQAELARRLGVSPAYISRIENGIQPMSLAIACGIADVLCCSLDELTGRKVVKIDDMDNS